MAHLAAVDAEALQSFARAAFFLILEVQPALPFRRLAVADDFGLAEIMPAGGPLGVREQLFESAVVNRGVKWVGMHTARRLGFAGHRHEQRGLERFAFELAVALGD